MFYKQSNFVSLTMLFMALVITPSCDKSEFNELLPLTTEVNIHEEEIEDAAIDFVNTLITPTRTANSLSVQEIKTIDLHQTRTDVKTPNFYSVSLNDSKGTVIMFEKSNDIKPLAYFRNEFNIDFDSVLQDTISDFSFIVQNLIDEAICLDIDSMPNTTRSGETIEKRVEPKCKVWWSQDAPYNYYCKDSDGNTAKAGCVAIAGAQALTVLQPKMPEVEDICSNSTPWNFMNRDIEPDWANTYAIATFVKFVGDHCNTHYGKNSTSGSVSKLSKWFKEYDIYDYDAKGAVDVLNTEHGVIVANGYRSVHGWGPWEHVVDGHTFLADGYVYTGGTYYFHLNYGWGKEIAKKAKDAYVLTSKKVWNIDEAREIYGTLYRNQLYYYSYAYRSEMGK